MATRTTSIRHHFDALAPEVERWRRRNRYYHDDQASYILHLTGRHRRILAVGCGNGDLLAALEPSRGVGIDLSPAMIGLAQRRHPNLIFFVGDAHRLPDIEEESFDFIVLSDLLGYLDDIQVCLEELHRFCHAETRIIVSSYNFLWEPVIKLAEALSLKMPAPQQSWLALDDLRNLLALTDFQIVKTERRLLFPKYLPLLSAAINRLGSLPGLSTLCLCQYVVARPQHRSIPTPLTVSIVIPTKNERGNIENAITRLPQFGAQQQIIFVDGHSTDGTAEEIQRVIAAHPDRSITLLRQTGSGKGDAVRLGFNHAQGDILMILDADLTVPPEDLLKFYRAIAMDKAEFLNGSRLIYPMESEAMRLLNLIANKIFAATFSWLLGQRLKDTLCGTKVLRRRHYFAIAENRSYFGDFDPFGDFDLLFGASKLNLKITEIPVRYRRRAYGETQISRFRHGWLLLRMVFFALKKIKWF